MHTTKMMGRALLILAAAIPMTAWGQQINTITATTQPVAAASTPAPKADDDRPALQQRNPRYQVQRDDVLIISFALTPELNKTVTVQPDGYISLENAGSIYVLGLSTPQIADAIKKAYAKTLHDPIVDVDLKDFQKPYFVALGQINKPGQYDLRYDMTVTEAIGVAGGFAPTAKTQVFLYHRVNNEWAEVRELKLNDILTGKKIAEDTHIQPGDMIFVPEKLITKIRKYVPYYIGASYSPPSIF
jgi:polysaccharide export outer membrane protein